jgi:hypothetical protein
MIIFFMQIVIMEIHETIYLLLSVNRFFEKRDEKHVKVKTYYDLFILTFSNIFVISDS